MKSNLKKLLALLLVALLTLSLTGLSEEEVVIEDGSATIDGISDDILSTEDADLAAQLNEIELSIPDIDLEAPKIKDTIASEAITESEATSNALVKKVVIGVKEKYTIDTSSLKGKLTFASVKPAIAAVTKKGVVVGKKVGTTKITITASKKKYTVTVTVRKAPAKVTLKPNEATLEIGDTLQLKAVLPNKTASYKIGWASSNKRVATVSKTGVVTAKAAGTATITVKTFNGKKATCQVTVNEPAPEVTPTPEPTPEIPLITVDKTDINLNVGETCTVQLTYNGNGKIYVSTSVSGIVKCEWLGQWNNRTTELYFTGANSGSTVVSVRDDAAGYSVPIYVTVIDSAPTPTPTPEPKPQGTETGELSRFYGKSIDYLNNVIADPVPNNYFEVFYDNTTRIIHGMRLQSGYTKYTLLGVYPGMKTNDAHAALIGNGFRTIGGDNLNWIYGNSQLYPGTHAILKRNTSIDGGIILSIEFAKD